MIHSSSRLKQSLTVLSLLAILLTNLPMNIFSVAESAGKPDKQEALITTEEQLFDSTGEVFETNKIEKETNKKEQTVDSSSSVELENKDGLFIEPDISTQPDANGIIITLKEKSLIDKNLSEENSGKSETQIKKILKSHKEQLIFKHQTTLSKLSKKLGVSLTKSSKPEKDKVRYGETFSSINSIILYDLPIKKSIDKLSGDEDILRVEANRKVTASLTESVPMIGADQVWQVISENGSALDGTGTNIGIIDTGVDYTHPDLGGCFGANCKVSDGYDFANDDNDPMDDHGHGTHVAATAAGNGSYIDSVGISHPIPGVAPKANIYAYKVLGSSGSGYTGAIVEAIDRCSDPNNDADLSDRLDVCSMSLGGSGTPDDSMSRAVDTATSNGTIFTVAAGNNGPNSDTITSPGTARNAITVAAAVKNSQLSGDPIASFSSRGPVNWIDYYGVSQSIMKPDISAPGVNICAATWASWKSSYCLDNSHVSISGTSMATPHVAGAAALIRQAHPNLTPAEIKNLIKSGAKNIGMSETDQGAGLLQINKTLELSGTPSGIVQVSDLPLLFTDNPTTSKFTEIKKITLKNITTANQTYSPSASEVSAGLLISFDQQSISLLPGATADLNLTVLVDNNIAKSPSQLTANVHLSNGTSEAKISLVVKVGNRLKTDPPSLYMGLDIASNPSWSASKPLTLTNLLTDSGSTYSATISQVENVAAKLDKTSITIPASGSATLNVNLSASNSLLTNQKYSFVLTLTSPNQVLSIPVYFYKGFQINFNYGAIPPNSLHLYNGLQQYSYHPSEKSTGESIIIWYAGPYDAQGLWHGDYKPTAGYQVLRQNISTSVVSDLSMNRSDANHTLTIKSPKIDGTEIFNQSTLDFQLTKISSGEHTGLGYAFSQSGLTYMVNDLPGDNENYSFSVHVTAEDQDDALYSYAYRFPSGINSNQLLSPQLDKFVKKNLVGFQNQNPQSDSMMRIASVSPGYTVRNGEDRFRNFSTNTYTLTNRGEISLPPKSTKPLYIYNNTNDDIATMRFPIYSTYLLHLGVLNNWTSSLYRSPVFSTNSSGTYAIDGKYEELTAENYKPFKVGEIYNNFQTLPSSSETITLGAAPMYTQSSWHNYANKNNLFLPQRDEKSPFQRWAGQSVESWSSEGINSNYSLSKEGLQIASGNSPYTDVNTKALYKLPVDATGLVQTGNYTFLLSRTAPINGTSTVTTSESTFKIVDEATHKLSPIDENPPSLSDLRLTSENLMQNVIDSSRNNRIKFSLNSNPGLLAPMPEFSWMRTPAYTRMSDSISSVTLEQSTDGINFQQVGLTTDGNNFSAEITNKTDVALYTFRIKARDLAGNTLTETFQIPSGTSMIIPGVDNSEPNVNISSPTAGQRLSGIAVVSATASDNIGISRVELWGNDRIIGTKTAAPYNFDFDTSKFTGDVSLIAKAFDQAGNTTSSQLTKVETSDGTSPTVVITAPKNGAIVKPRQSIALTAQASNNTAVTKVQFFINNVLQSTDTTAPYSYSWKVPNAKKTTFTITVKAFDSAGNVGQSSIIVKTL